MGNLWLRHNGKRIYFVNFGDCEKVGDALECLLQAYQSISDSKGKVLLLYNFDSPAVRARDFQDQFREIYRLSRFRDKIERAAVFGQSGSKAMLARDKAIKRFDTRQDALDWLVWNGK